MTNTENPEVSRLLVGFLRLFAGMTQAEFGEATGIGQSPISRYELGKDTPSEKQLRRLAKVAKVPWLLAVPLRRFLEAFVAATTRRRTASMAEPLGLGILEPALMAAAPYLVEAKAAPSRRQTPEEALREAEEIWAALQEDPIPERRRLIELALDAAKSWALALRIGEASVQANHDSGESRELAELALSIAERVPGEESLHIQSLCWGYVALARRAAGNVTGSDEALARSRDLWQAGAKSETDLLTESRLPDLEAFLAAGRAAVLRSAGAV